MALRRWPAFPGLRRGFRRIFQLSSRALARSPGPRNMARERLARFCDAGLHLPLYGVATGIRRGDRAHGSLIRLVGRGDDSGLLQRAQDAPDPGSSRRRAGLIALRCRRIRPATSFNVERDKSTARRDCQRPKTESLCHNVYEPSSPAGVMKANSAVPSCARPAPPRSS